MKKNKKESKSATTYSNFIEISIDPTLFNNFSNDSSISSFLGNLSSSEEFQKLRADLIKELMNIIENELTQKQKEIIKLTYIEGKTQNEISHQLGTHQTAIHKSLSGNLDYSNNGRKRYGGALKKIRKLCSKNKIIQDLLIKIKEKNEQNNE